LFGSKFNGYLVEAHETKSGGFNLNQHQKRNYDTKAFENFIQESELFFVKKFITSETIKRNIRLFGRHFRHHKDKDTTKGVIAFSQKNMVKENRFFFDVVNHRHRRLVVIYTSEPRRKNWQNLHKHGEWVKIPNQVGRIHPGEKFIDDIGDEGENKTFSHYATN
jgi:hypothetical protein